MKRKKKKNKKSGAMGIALAALGVGIVMVCIFPSKWMVVITASALIAAGILLSRC